MQQHDLTVEALQRGAIPGPGYTLARQISRILHPVPLGVLNFFLVGSFGVTPLATGLGWALLCTLLQVLPPTLFFLIRLRQGAYTDEDISVRQQRNELYLFGAGNLVISIAILLALHAPLPFIALLAGGIVINTLCWAINLFWKISIHSAGIGSVATVAIIYSQPAGMFLWACALALAWARIRTRNHTLMQVIAGMSLAAACVLIIFEALGLPG